MMMMVLLFLCQLSPLVPGGFIGPLVVWGVAQQVFSLLLLFVYLFWGFFRFSISRDRLPRISIDIFLSCFFVLVVYCLPPYLRPFRGVVVWWGCLGAP
jgi:hypothetical protein